MFKKISLFFVFLLIVNSCNFFGKKDRDSNESGANSMGRDISQIPDFISARVYDPPVMYEKIKDDTVDISSCSTTISDTSCVKPFVDCMGSLSTLSCLPTTTIPDVDPLSDEDLQLPTAFEYLWDNGAKVVIDIGSSDEDDSQVTEGYSGDNTLCYKAVSNFENQTIVFQDGLISAATPLEGCVTITCGDGSTEVYEPDYFKSLLYPIDNCSK